VKTEDKKQTKVAKLAKGELLLINIGSTSTGGRVLSVKADLAKIQLTSPACTEIGEKVALSRRIEKHWRLVGACCAVASPPRPHAYFCAQAGAVSSAGRSWRSTRRFTTRDVLLPCIDIVTYTHRPAMQEQGVFAATRHGRCIQCSVHRSLVYLTQQQKMFLSPSQSLEQSYHRASAPLFCHALL
jgi:hypothetical protein